MISKKLCMLGAFSVGKTSLVSQYVHSLFSDKYLSTVGVKISKKQLRIEDKDLSLVLWDMEGKDIYADINVSYLRGAMGFFVVADGTRKETLDTALTLRELAIDLLGPIPNKLLLNKSDMRDNWEMTNDILTGLTKQEISFLYTSAKTGEGVHEAFTAIAGDMLKGQYFGG